MSLEENSVLNYIMQWRDFLYICALHHDDDGESIADSKISGPTISRALLKRATQSLGYFNATFTIEFVVS